MGIPILEALHKQPARCFDLLFHTQDSRSERRPAILSILPVQAALPPKVQLPAIMMAATSAAIL
jgi:hypothetical protein